MPISKKAATELITRFAEAVRAHQLRVLVPIEDRRVIVHNYREARSDLAVHFHQALDELEGAEKKRTSSLFTAGNALPKYVRFAVNNYSFEVTDYDMWVWHHENGRSEGDFFTEAEAQEGAVIDIMERLTREYEEVKAQKKDLERRLAEANALLDKVYQYVDTKQLGKLGQSRVKSLMDAHEYVSYKLSRYSMDAGQADQRLLESRAVRKALGFGEDADDVSPRDLLDAIEKIKTT